MVAYGPVNALVEILEERFACVRQKDLGLVSTVVLEWGDEIRIGIHSNL